MFALRFDVHMTQDSAYRPIPLIFEHLSDDEQRSRLTVFHRSWSSAVRSGITRLNRLPTNSSMGRSPSRDPHRRARTCSHGDSSWCVTRRSNVESGKRRRRKSGPSTTVRRQTTGSPHLRRSAPTGARRSPRCGAGHLDPHTQPDGISVVDTRAPQERKTVPADPGRLPRARRGRAGITRKSLDEIRIKV